MKILSSISECCANLLWMEEEIIQIIKGIKAKNINRETILYRLERIARKRIEKK